jgi:hypothetical protein
MRWWWEAKDRPDQKTQPLRLSLSDHDNQFSPIPCPAFHLAFSLHMLTPTYNVQTTISRLAALSTLSGDGKAVHSRRIANLSPLLIYAPALLSLYDDGAFRGSHVAETVQVRHLPLGRAEYCMCRGYICATATTYMPLRRPKSCDRIYVSKFPLTS